MASKQIGVVICDCHGEISGKIDTASLENEIKKLDNISFIKRYDAICNKTACQEIASDLKKSDSDGFLFAGCSPRSSLRFPEIKISKLLESVNIDHTMFEVANLREQGAWLHDAGKGLDAKALDEIKMAYARLAFDDGKTENVSIAQKALIIGGGAAGLAAAKDLAGMGKKVTIVENTPYLGGRLNQIRILFQSENWSGKCIHLCVGPVQAQDALFESTVSAYVNSSILDIKKDDGNFHVTIQKKPDFVDPEKCISCGKCSAVCKEFAHSDFNEGLFVRKAIDKEFERAVPDTYSILKEFCNGCGDCVEVCPSGAISLNDKAEIIDDVFGTVFLSTGFDMKDLSKLPEYGSTASNVISGLDLERLFDHGVTCPSNKEAPESIVFVLCSGSRATDEKIAGGVPYCSKICCGTTMKQIIQLSQVLPEVEITVIHYYDIRTYERAFEALYDTAKKLGVEFIQGNLDSIEEKSAHSLSIKVAQLGEQSTSTMEEYVFEDGELSIESDLVVLASAQTPRKSSNEIINKLSIMVDQHGFPVENQPRIFRPTETMVDRVYVAGASRGPVVVQQAVEQGRAAAMNALPHLIRGEKTPVKYLSAINPERCVSCKFCETVCPHGAIYFKEDKMVVDPGFCQGCGLCQAACPTHAANLINFSDEQILEQSNVAFSGLSEGEPKIMALLCYWCSYCGADLAGKNGFTLPDNFRSIRIRCSSSVNTSLILEMFKRGVDGVLVGGCPPNSCHHMHGNYLADKRISLCVKFMKQLGLDSNRLRFEYIGVPHSKKFADNIVSMDKKLRELGPNPVASMNKEVCHE